MTFGKDIKIYGRLNLTPAAGDVASPQDGDIWYNQTSGKFRKQENGVTSDMDTNTGGTFDYGKDIATSTGQNLV